MPTASRPQSAVPSALGFYFQGLYALVLVSNGSDEALVSVEKGDDVELNDGTTSLHQIKHSRDEPPSLTLADVGFWKAILNWSGRALDGTEDFVFVTCAPIAEDSSLHALATVGSDRSALQTEMIAEAFRVRHERAEAKKAKKPLPHAPRTKGCEKFLKLTTDQQQRLIQLIRIVPKNFNIAAAPTRLQATLGGCMRPELREPIFERLIEWWDRQVVLSLLGKRSRQLGKIEVQTQICRLMNEHYPDSLPDDFSWKKPDGDDNGVGRVMAKQIEWVNGGPSRLSRAALARWRSRNQRERWIKGDISIAAALLDYDAQLKEKWSERFGPMSDDCKDKKEAARTAAGLTILEWSHIDATKDVPPIRESWPHSFLIQGSLQQLAEEGEIGWHPDYSEKLKALKKEGK